MAEIIEAEEAFSEPAEIKEDSVQETEDVPKAAVPRAEIIVESEEDARAAAAKMHARLEGGEDLTKGSLAEAERRHEAEERRRATREKNGSSGNRRKDRVRLPLRLFLIRRSSQK